MHWFWFVIYVVTLFYLPAVVREGVKESPLMLWLWPRFCMWLICWIQADRLRLRRAQAVIPDPKTVLGRVVASCVQISGNLGVLLRTRGRRVHLLADEAPEQLELELIWPRKPPDPPAPSKSEVKKTRKKRRRKLLRCATLAAGLPLFMLASDRALAETLQAYVSPQGVLRTKSLPKETVEAVRANLAEMPQGLLAGVDSDMAIADTGCSGVATPCRDDFITYEELSEPRSLSGIGSGIQIKGKGVVRYELLDSKGRVRPIEREAMHAPDLPVRLIPPQAVFPAGSVGQCVVADGRMTWHFRNGQVVPIDINPATRLPEIRLFRNVDKAAEQLDTALLSCVTEESNQNISPAQKRLLQLHFRLGHLAMDSVRWLAKHGALGAKIPTEILRAQAPLCATCQYAKQVRTSTGATRTEQRAEKELSLKDNVTEPGELTAIDQFEVIKKGRLFKSRGREKATMRYIGGTLFVDVASGRVRCYFQPSLDAASTVQSKMQYERESRQYGVLVQRYHSDNGVFTAAAFQNELEKQGQPLTLAGVGGHHQNAIAERNIRTVMTRTRALLLHAMLRWPDVTQSDLWPMAMQHAELLCNHVPKQASGYSPLQLFSRNLKALKDNEILATLPVWGCPVYVLEPTLQDGRKLPKWQPRSRRGQYVGMSPYHASNVALVRNLTTGSIGPQFHVVFDNWFETVHADEESGEPPPEWEILVNHSRFRADFEEDDINKLHLDDEWLTPSEIIAVREQIRRERERSRQQHPPPRPKRQQQQQQQPRADDAGTGAAQPDPSRTPDTKPKSSVEPLPSRGSPSVEPLPSRGSSSPLRGSDLIEPLNRADDESNTLNEETRSRIEQVPDEDSPLRHGRTRSGRRYQALLGVKPTNSVEQGVFCYLSLADRVNEVLASSEFDEELEPLAAVAVYRAMLATDPATGMPDDWANEPPIVIEHAYKARKNYDPDTPNFGQAMRSQYAEEFKAAMQSEIESLIKHGTWQGVLRSSLPEGANVIPSTWAFKIKRLPDSSIYKWKARACVRGDKQIDGVDVFETYAPVVSWSAVRSLLAFALQKDLKTRQVDFSSAFVQSKLPESEQVYIEMPRGCKDPEGRDIVLKLKRSLYGMRQSPYHWFRTLKEGLEALGYEQSNNEKCMFTHKHTRMILLIYVDDVLLFHKSDEVIDDAIDALRGRFELTEEQIDQNQRHTVFQYLGIELIDRKPTTAPQSKIAGILRSSSNTDCGRAMMLRQPKLIHKILKTVGMENCTGDVSPAREMPFGSDLDGEPFNEEWDYASVVGMFLYLVNTRPDIQFAVTQAARFTHCPKQSHAAAIKRICRYLKATADKGLVYRPDTITSGEALKLDCYVDADFAGLYEVEDNQDPISSRSRTGYVFVLGQCPVLWASKLQTETALSTVEAEYIALAMAMRDLLHLRRLIQEMAAIMEIPIAVTKMNSKCFKQDGTGDVIPAVKSTVYEDNMGAIAVAKAPSLTPRTRHINNKYHFFKSHLGEDKGVVLKHVASTFQIGDLFTKGVKAELYEHLRDILMGWTGEYALQRQRQTGERNRPSSPRVRFREGV